MVLSFTSVRKIVQVRDFESNWLPRWPGG